MGPKVKDGNTLGHVARITAMRLQDHLGWMGWVGLALLVASGAVVVFAQKHRAQVADVIATPIETPSAAAPLDVAVDLRPLPRESDVPLIIARLERTARAEGLGWPRTEYHLVAATNEVPASIEVRCALEGAYPSLRRFLTAALLDTPTMTVRELSLSRTNTENPTVQARLTLVAFLAAGNASGSP